jgi:hypothetical protein
MAEEGANERRIFMESVGLHVVEITDRADLYLNLFSGEW